MKIGDRVRLTHQYVASHLTVCGDGEKWWMKPGTITSIQGETAKVRWDALSAVEVAYMLKDLRPA